MFGTICSLLLISDVKQGRMLEVEVEAKMLASSPVLPR